MLRSDTFRLQGSLTGWGRLMISALAISVFFVLYFPLGLFNIPPAFPKAFGIWSCKLASKKLSDPGGAPPFLHSHQSSQVPERESVLRSAPLLHQPDSSPRLEHLLPSKPPGWARRDESTSDSDPKWSPCLFSSSPVAAMDRSKEISLSLLFPDHGKIQSDPLIPVCWRELGPHQEFLILDDFHPALPSSDLLAWSDYWLCFYSDTSWCSSTCCLAGPHYILEKNYWEEAEWILRLLRRYVSHVSPSPGLVKLLALS